MTAPVLSLRAVTLERDGRRLLEDVTWQVLPGERWVVLGPNGAGKTSLLAIASLWLHPTSGTVEVLGSRLGGVDVRTIRPRIGVASAALADRLRGDLEVRDVVVTARHAALEPWWHHYDLTDRAAADEAMARVGVGHLERRRFGTLSSGERQRVQLARTLVRDPELLLLDEPAAGLDLGGREDLLRRLGALAADGALPAAVLVTHHVEEIPPGWTHALLLRDGRSIASGPVADVLTATALSDLFGVPLSVGCDDDRWWARARS